MDKNGVKVSILWPKETQWYFCKFWKTYLGVNPTLYASPRAKRILCKALRTVGHILKKFEDSFNKNTPQGVSSVRGHRSPIGRLRNHQGRTPASRPPELNSGAAAPWIPLWSSPATGVPAKLCTREQRDYTGRMRSIPRARLCTLLRLRTRMWSSRRRRKGLCSARSKNVMGYKARACFCRSHGNKCWVF